MMRRATALLLLAALGGSACGTESPPIPLDPLTADTAQTPLASDSEPQPTTTAAPVDDDVVAGDAWVDVTANLTGMRSWCGNLAFVSARPDRDEVIASVVGQGLFRTDSQSDEWRPFARDPASAPIDHRASSFVYDPENPDRFWESGFFGLGPPPDPMAADINRTDDGGGTFVSRGESVPADLVSVDFTDPGRQTLVVGAHGQPRVLGSRDGGETWTDLSGGLSESVGDASFPHVLDATTYLLGTHKGAEAGIYRTTDAGATWTQVFEDAVSGPPLASDDGNLYWVADDGGIIRSADGGASWEPLESRAPAGGERKGRIVELDDGRWLTRGVEYMLLSDDRGQSWRTVGAPLPYDPSGFTYSVAGNAVYIWLNYCEVADQPDPVREGAILRLDLDLGP